MSLIKQETSLKVQQKLSPLQIMTIKLIELPAQDLERRVEQELEENPALDDTPQKADEYDDAPRRVSIDTSPSAVDPIPSYNLKVNNRGKDDDTPQRIFPVKESFQQSLIDQLGFCNLTEKQYEIANFIIFSLDDRGYLRRDTETLMDDLAFKLNIDATQDEIEDMIEVIQSFEPAGVCARDLQECLLLQLKNMTQSESVVNATRILENFFKDYAAKHYEKIIQRLGIDTEAFKKADIRIKRLNPFPGGISEDAYVEQAQQVIPDFELKLQNGELNLSMPRFSVPELRVNPKYSEMIERAEDSQDRKSKEAATFAKSKLDQAKWFVEALKQRQNTLYKTMSAIIDYQKEYFLEGDETLLKPMVLKNIAEKTGFDISTISRVVNSKYVETHFGIYPLKYFFSEGLENKDGEEVSTRELKLALRNLVDSEDKHNPLTDEELVAQMEKAGYKVARRTIAKYRDQLGIVSARLRKEI